MVCKNCGKPIKYEGNGWWAHEGTYYFACEQGKPRPDPKYAEPEAAE